MPDQPDLWPLRAPKSDPDLELRERWRRALLILGAVEVSGLAYADVRRWVENPAMPDSELAGLIYGSHRSKLIVVNALEFLAEIGLIDG